MKKAIIAGIIAVLLVFGGVSAYAIQGLDESPGTRILAQDGYATLTTDKVGGSVTTTKSILLNNSSVSQFGVHITDTYSVFTMDNEFVKSLVSKVTGNNVTFRFDYNGDKTAVTFEILDGKRSIFGSEGRCVGEIPYTAADGVNPNHVMLTNPDGRSVGLCGYYPDASMIRWQLSGGGKYTVKVNAVAFDDVPINYWGKAYIEYLASKGVINGMGNGNFEPDGSLTRAQFVTLLAMMSNDPLGGNVESFTDVDPSDWYYNAVAWAASAGVTSGYDDGTFRPEYKITREQVARMVLNFYDYMNVDAVPVRSADAFTDADTISSWAANEVSICQQLGIINGFPEGTFRPQGTATRAEAATMCSRMVAHILILPQ